MEYAAGGDLKSRISAAHPTYNERTMRKWMAQTLRAVDYLHTITFYIHGDIKPANILLTGNDDVRLADFGLAK